MAHAPTKKAKDKTPLKPPHDGEFVPTGVPEPEEARQTTPHEPAPDQDGAPQPHERTKNYATTLVPNEPAPGETWGEHQARISIEREKALADGKKLPPQNGLTSPSDRDENNQPNRQAVDR